MTITIKINTDNAAFESRRELRRILLEAVDQVTSRTRAELGPLRDVNGNTVGSVTVRGK